MRPWTPFIAPSLKQLHEDNRATNRTLGIIRPDAGSLKFFSKPAKDADAEDRDVAEQVLQMQQSSFLEQPAYFTHVGPAFHRKPGRQFTDAGPVSDRAAGHG